MYLAVPLAVSALTPIGSLTESFSPMSNPERIENAQANGVDIATGRFDLIRGVTTNSAFPPSAKRAEK